MITCRPLSILTLSLLLGLALTGEALAHQPFFEEERIGPNNPWKVADPTVSTALYFTLEDDEDVDYLVFDGKAGQEILVGMTIPQIPGQELFAPAIAVMGPSLASSAVVTDALPSRVGRPERAGVYIIPRLTGPAPTFFEPFSGTSYWTRQEQKVTLPADGRYTVAVWDPENQVGRYVLAIGDKEIPGGDPQFPLKMRSYWTPVVAPTAPSAPAVPTGAVTPGSASSTTSYDTVFPLPSDVKNFTGAGGENTVNFQTSLNLDELVTFYRQALGDKGLTERAILTAINDKMFSMVFDGWGNGKDFVIQSVQLGPARNVNIRFEAHR
jgi:hypothetical protein